jgi:lysophospholipase L1-like esterase
MTQVVGYPAGNGLLSGTTQSQRPAPLGENRLPAPEATSLTASQVAWVQSSSSGGVVTPPGLTQRVVLLGDSFAGNANFANSGVTLTRSGGVVTVTGATSHKAYPGSLISIRNTALSADELTQVPVRNFISTTSFDYLSPGADGVIAAGAVQIQIIYHHSFQDGGFWTHFNRLTSGAYTLVNNAGFPGNTSTVICQRVATHVAPYSPDRIIWLCGYNDINGDAVSFAQTVANIKTAVDAYPSALWDVFATWPWLAGAAANTAAHLRQVTRYYGALKKQFASYRNVRIHNSHALTGGADGLAKTGYISTSDNVHPTPRAFYEVAAYLVALDSTKQTPAQLPTTTLDTVSADAASKHINDNPLMQTSVASTLTNVTGNMPTGFSGALTGTGATGVGALVARSNTNEGNNFTVTYTPAAADNALRISYALTTSRLPSGSVIDKLACKVSVSGMVAGNVKGACLQLVFIADGVTYASNHISDGSFAALAIAAAQQTDLVDAVLCLRNIPVPVYTSLTLARIDVIVNHFAAGTQVVASVAQLDCEMV